MAPMVGKIFRVRPRIVGHHQRLPLASEELAGDERVRVVGLETGTDTHTQMLIERDKSAIKSQIEMGGEAETIASV